MTDKTHIAVLVSGGGTNLQAILDAQAAGKITDGKVVLVVSSSVKAYALERAKAAGIPAKAVTKKKYGSAEKVEEALISLLEENRIELIVLAGFLTVLSENFTRRYPRRILNIHPSLIPSFCGDGYYGLKVHEEALKRGVKVTGATVHFVNEITDGGEILFQKAVDVLPGDTPEILQRRVMEEAEWILLPKAVQAVSKEIREAKSQAPRGLMPR